MICTVDVGTHAHPLVVVDDVVLWPSSEHKRIWMSQHLKLPWGSEIWHEHAMSCHPSRATWICEKNINSVVPTWLLVPQWSWCLAHRQLTLFFFRHWAKAPWPQTSSACTRTRDQNTTLFFWVFHIEFTLTHMSFISIEKQTMDHHFGLCATRLRDITKVASQKQIHLDCGRSRYDIT